jgi:hypothetical protein
MKDLEHQTEKFGDVQTLRTNAPFFCWGERDFLGVAQCLVGVQGRKVQQVYRKGGESQA